MDIPNSGAVFTLGKAYLTDNSQNYFYIKNDPIRRIITGPHQSAVICESGRLFCWGENDCGQLALGGISHYDRANNNNNNNNSATSHLVKKPTCVRALKTLGLRITDAAFGIDWSVMLTHSNEIFFSGHNIFQKDTKAAHNCNEPVELHGEKFNISRKPFRLPEFDDFLSKNEEAENFVNVQAGHNHFIVQTSFGRLIGWGSNEQYQLGILHEDGNQSSHVREPMTPYEIQLDAPVKHYVCGPQSTLVLTQTDNLYLTGCLNDFIFSNFTKLQQNLSPTENIVFMHISITNEIYIVTNAANIYRSKENTTNRMLMFQRFHDYDSLENGPVWKLLRGFSFFAALTKSHRFFTTFSESGHHLKTFREISKFKNLRLLDMAVGEQHVLVFGILKSAIVPTTFGPDKQHTYISQAYILDASSRHSASNAIMVEKSAKTVLSAVQHKEKIVRTKDAKKSKEEALKDQVKVQEEVVEKVMEEVVEEEVVEKKVDEDVKVEKEELEEKVKKDENGNKAEIEEDKTDKLPERKSSSSGSHSSVHVQLPRDPDKDQEDRVASSGKRLVRQHTPYPGGNSANSTPLAHIKTPLRNQSYETAVNENNLNNNDNANIMSKIMDIEDDEQIDATSLQLVESVEDIRQELSDSKITKISTIESQDGEEQLIVETITETNKINSKQHADDHDIRFINDGIDVTALTERLKDNGLEEAKENTVQEADSLLAGIKDTALDAVGAATNKVKSFKDNLQENIVDSADKLKSVASETTDNIISNAKQAMQNMGEKLSHEVQSAKDSMGELLRVGQDGNGDVDDNSEPLSTSEGRKANLLLLSEDDERTTVSINSNHNSSGNPFENGNNNNKNDSNGLDDGLDDNAIVARGKRALEEELEQRSMSNVPAAGRGGAKNAGKTNDEKGMMRTFFNEIRDKSKSITCQSEKSIPVVDELVPTVGDGEEEEQVRRSNNTNNESKICVIL